MRVKYESSFLSDVQRIDNIINIDSGSVNGGERNLKPEVIYDNESGILHVYVESGMSRCRSLEFYYGDSKAFTLSESSGEMMLNPEKTLFELKFPSSVKPVARIECRNLDSDTKFLESPGYELGQSLYKDIEVDSDSLVWKESIGKYMTEKGQLEDKDFTVEVMDTLDGQLKSKSYRFKSYQNLVIEQGDWEIDTKISSKTVKQDVYSEISSTSFLYWDSPLIDSSVSSKTATCIENYDVYLDPGNVIFGGTDCFQYIKYSKENQIFKGFRVFGTSGSVVEAMFNRQYTDGPYTGYTGVVTEDGYVDILVEDLEFYHLNGIISAGPCKVSRIETIIYRDNVIDVVTPNPDKTYVAPVGKDSGEIRILGVCDYIEYENYLGEIKEIGRGTESIESIAGISITEVENDGLNGTIDILHKKVTYIESGFTRDSYISATYSIKIDNNLILDEDGKIATSELISDYKVKIKQAGIVWINITSPDYIDKETGIDRNLYVLGYQGGSTKTIRILTNIETFSSGSFNIVDGAWNSAFNIRKTTHSDKIYYEEDYWWYIDIQVTTLYNNTQNTWIPKTENGRPIPIQFKYGDKNLDTITFYSVQKMMIEPELEIWEETLPGKYTKLAESSMTLYNTLTKNFIVVKRVPEIDETDTQVWYYRDLSNTNKFFITDLNNNTTISGSIYYLTDAEEERKEESEKGIIDLSNAGMNRYVRVLNVIRSDYINSLGVLTVTESASRPNGWTNLINTNTINIEVFRELTNIYVKVGTSIDDALNEDFDLVVTKINVYPIYLITNFKYFIKVNENGYFRLLNSSYEEYTEEKVLTGYNGTSLKKVALIRLDTESGLEETEIEVRSGNVTRMIRVKLGKLVYDHSYDYKTSTIKPNRIRFVNNGSSEVLNQVYKYSSTTTPEITFNKVSGTSIESKAYFDDSYKEHNTKIGSLKIPTPTALSRTKFPISTFGSVQENSLSYSDDEGEKLEYLYYMKGLTHGVWYSDSLFDFSDIDERTAGESTAGVRNKTLDIFLNTSGDGGRTTYVVSRYSPDNRTFRVNYPSADQKIKMNDLEATIDIQDWGRLSASDPITQIEYYLPVNVSSNIKNDGGNVYIGSYKISAITNITDTSIPDIIDASDELIAAENINASYITSYITQNFTDNLEIRVFQEGSNKNALNLYSQVDSMLSVDDTIQYIIPEIGSNKIIDSITYTKDSNTNYTFTYEEIDNVNVGGEQATKYFLGKVDVKKRITSNTWYNTSTEVDKIKKISTDLENYIQFKLTSGSSTASLTSSFKQSGYHKGLVYKQLGQSYAFCGVGHYDSGNNYVGSGATSISVTASGQYEYKLLAGISQLSTGTEPTTPISSAEFLGVPTKYYFDGPQPEKVSWESGNLNDSVGNLIIKFPPRGKNEEGDKVYTLIVEEPDDYCPLKIAIKFTQSGNSSGYAVNFKSDKIGVYSNGEIAEGLEDGKIYFNTNINSNIFDKVYFALGQAWNDHSDLPNPSIPTVDFNPKDHLDTYGPDDMSLITETERNLEEGYVKIKFRPNGSCKYITTKLWAVLRGVGPVGSIDVEIGYCCLVGRCYNISGGLTKVDPIVYNYTEMWNMLSRISPNIMTGATQSSVVFRVPCKANDDNSEAKNVESAYQYPLEHRQVLHLILKRREYGQEAFGDVSLSGTNVKVELMSISYQDTIFEETSLILNSRSGGGGDYDAYGIARRTEMNYGNFTPYLEVTYKVKDEYIRTGFMLNALGKITHTDIDTGLESVFYFSRLLYKTASNEPPSPDLLEVNNDSITLPSIKGATSKVSYTPVTYSDYINVEISNIEDESSTVLPKWVTANTEIPGIVEFKASSNAIVTRRTTAELNYIDPRSPEGQEDVLKKVVIYIEQEGEIKFSTNEVWLDWNVSSGNEQCVSFTPQTSYNMTVISNGCCTFDSTSLDLKKGLIKILAREDNDTHGIKSGSITFSITDPNTGVTETWAINVHQRYQE